MKFGMIDRHHLDNIRKLLDVARPLRRHLNRVQPFEKAAWVRPWVRSAAVFHDRRPRLAPAPPFHAEFIAQLNAEGNDEKTKIKNKHAFGMFLNGSYRPGGKGSPIAEQLPVGARQ
eukprot:489213-Prymnesium_polylepis.1